MSAFPLRMGIRSVRMSVHTTAFQHSLEVLASTKEEEKASELKRIKFIGDIILYVILSNSHKQKTELNKLIVILYSSNNSKMKENNFIHSCIKRIK